MNLRVEDISEVILRHLPEVRPEHDKIVGDWAGEFPGGHVIAGDLLNPLIEVAMERYTAADKEVLLRVGAVLEEMAENGNDDVKNIVAATVLERFVGAPQAARVHECLGPCAQRIWKEVCEWWSEFGRCDADDEKV